MTWAFVRREWGAITFVLTVLVGLIVVPLSLYFLNQGPSAVSTPTICAASSARASSAQTATSVPSPSPCTTT